MREFIDIVDEAVIKLRGAAPAGSPVDQFMKTYREVTVEHPMDRASRLLGMASLSIRPSLSIPDGVYISDIRALEPGSGHGSAAMKSLCHIADRCGVTMELIAVTYANKDSYRPGEKKTAAELARWYSSFGFKATDWEGQRGAREMIREPQFED